jgi:uncharacterized membrane protein
MSESAGPDARLVFIYNEALRGLVQQQEALESLRVRAGTLIFASSFASSLLGSRALAAGLGPWDWLAIALLFSIGILTVIMLWPYYDLNFRVDPEDLLNRFVDQNEPVSSSAMYRSLALQVESDRRSNGRIVKRMREAFEFALVLLLFNILAWLFSIAQVFGSK